MSHLLACPTCGGALAISQDNVACAKCGAAYKGDSDQFDLRLQAPKSQTITYQVGSGPPDLSCLADDLRPNPNPDLDWRNVSIDSDLIYGNRMCVELVSYFPRAKTNEQWMLDLGCGARNFESFCKRVTGLNYVGVDYSGADPDILVDAHALPFKDTSFDLIMSMAVLEHLANPDVVMGEAYRVLKPGGIFTGSVAFLEPFHGDSHFHMTHLGLMRILRDAGFELLTVAPNRQWTGMRALAELCLLPAVPRPIQRATTFPVEMMSRGLWWMRKAIKQGVGRNRVIETTAGFRFACRRPLGPTPASQSASPAMH